MPNIDTWLGTDYSDVLNAEGRAALAWRRIQDRPVSIVLAREGAGDLAAQTMRLESDNTVSDTTSSGTNMQTAIQKVTLFGVRDHATIPDTDIERSDRFRIDGVRYEVMALMTPPGEVQAVCEARRTT
jgi:hypothetical protein